MSPRKLEPERHFNYEYSVCTLVNNPAEHREMVESYLKAGFEKDQTEFIYADNSKTNSFDAYTALNRFLSESQGRYIIICHQDILLIDNKSKLQDCIENISALDPSWAILSNAGAVGLNYLSMLISYPGDRLVKKGSPPQKVISVDENFILIKSSTNLAISADMQGFHMYGTELCLLADMLGYSAYTIPFNLLHKSVGNVSESFWESKRAIIKKYNQKMRGRWIQTTITHLYVSGSAIDRIVRGNIIILMLIKALNSLKKKRS